MAKRIKLDDVAKVQLVKEYVVERTITLRELLALGWLAGKDFDLYDPEDKQVYRASDLWDWAQDNPQKGNTKFLVVSANAANSVNLIKKEKQHDHVR